jgi:lysophospholipase
VRVVGRILARVAPGLGLIGVDAALVSRDPAVVQAYRGDPLVHHGKLPAGTLVQLAGAIERFPSAVGAITVPTLIAYGTEDGLCPPAGSVMLGERIGSADVTVRPFEGLYHEIVNEPEQDAVLDELCGWLAAHVPAAGSVPAATA